MVANQVVVFSSTIAVQLFREKSGPGVGQTPPQLIILALQLKKGEPSRITVPSNDTVMFGPSLPVSCFPSAFGAPFSLAETKKRMKTFFYFSSQFMDLIEDLDLGFLEASSADEAPPPLPVPAQVMVVHPTPRDPRIPVPAPNYAPAGVPCGDQQQSMSAAGHQAPPPAGDASGGSARGGSAPVPPRGLFNEDEITWANRAFCFAHELFLPARVRQAQVPRFRDLLNLDAWRAQGVSMHPNLIGMLIIGMAAGAAPNTFAQLTNNGHTWATAALVILREDA